MDPLSKDVPLAGLYALLGLTLPSLTSCSWPPSAMDHTIELCRERRDLTPEATCTQARLAYRRRFMGTGTPYTPVPAPAAAPQDRVRARDRLNAAPQAPRPSKAGSP